jgi:hypothetical protein
VNSTVDPDTRLSTRASSTRQDGFKAHVAIEPDTGIITDCALPQASGTPTLGNPPRIAVRVIGPRRGSGIIGLT